MPYSFFCSGHPNVLSEHRNTLEFTKSKELSTRGDCIVGVDSDFDPNRLIEIAQKGGKVKILIECEGIKDEINGELNSHFSDKHEIVIRKSDYSSERTFAVKADKAAVDINRKIVDTMKDGNCRMKVTIKAMIKPDH